MTASGMTSEKISQPDTETLLAFALLTPALYLHLTKHVQSVLPVTCLVPSEKRSVLHTRDSVGRRRRMKAVEELYENFLNIQGESKHAV